MVIVTMRTQTTPDENKSRGFWKNYGVLIKLIIKMLNGFQISNLKC